LADATADALLRSLGGYNVAFDEPVILVYTSDGIEEGEGLAGRDDRAVEEFGGDLDVGGTLLRRPGERGRAGAHKLLYAERCHVLARYRGCDDLAGQVERALITRVGVFLDGFDDGVRVCLE